MEIYLTNTVEYLLRRNKCAGLIVMTCKDENVSGSNNPERIIVLSCKDDKVSDSNNSEDNFSDLQRF